MMPNTLRIRPTTRITSGNVTFSLASQTSGEPSFSASLQAADLAALDRRSSVRLEGTGPGHGEFPIHADGPVIDQLVCHTEFLDVVASGRWNSGSANVQGDLNRMAAELGRFVDLGEFRMAGRVDGQLQWEQAAAERLNATGQIELRAFELAAAGSLPWREERLVIDVAGQAEMAQGQITKIPTATFDLQSGRDQLTVRLAQAGQHPVAQATWPLELQVSGLLETWLPRLQPVVRLQGWQASGAIDLTAAATVAANSWQPARCVWPSATCVCRTLPLGVAVDENTVRLETAGTWDFATNRLKAADTTLTSSTVALRAQEVELQLPGERAAIRGTVGYRADLNRLAQWLQAPGQPATSRLTGSATGSLRATHDDQLTRTGLDHRSGGFRLCHSPHAAGKHTGSDRLAAGVVAGCLA
jgi:translocation and assembly module TamB